MLCLYYNMFWELLKANLNNSVNIQVDKIFSGRLVVPVVLLCILVVIIKQKKVVIGDGNVFLDVLLWHERGSGGVIIAVFKHYLHSSNIPYF